MPISNSRRGLSIFMAALVVLLLSPGRMAEADTHSADVTNPIAPFGLVTTSGAAVGAVTRLAVQNQSGIADDPTKYVLLSTPGVATYQGYRVYNLPGSVSAGAVTGIKIKANFKGPAKAAQAWSWFVYDWTAPGWVKFGDNGAATSNVWKTLTFSKTTKASRFINNATGKIWVRITSNNALYDGKLDYESVTLTYEPCPGTLGCVYVGAADPIHIAYLLNEPGLGSLEGAQIAIDAWSTGILGHSISFDGFQRPQCNPTDSLADANKLVKDASIVGVIGTSCSPEAMAIRGVITGVGLSMISPSNTSPGLTETPVAGYLRVSWNDNEMGELAAEYALNVLSATTATTLDDGGGYSTGVANAFATAFDLTQTVNPGATVSADQTDLRSQLTSLATGSPDVIFMPLFMPTAIYAVNQARATAGLGTVHLIGSDTLFDENLMLSTGTDLEGFLLTGTDPTQFSAAYTSTFVPAYEAKFPSTPMGQFAPYGYDAFYVMASAISSSATDLGGGAHLVDLEALRDALYATTGHTGLTGTITCDPDGECAATPALGVYEAHQNEWGPTLVYP